MTIKTPRQKAMLVGLFMSKFGDDGISRLGFQSFTESCNIIGLSLGIKSTSLRNYRDEFDPFFPNARKGWRNRDPYPDRLALYNSYGNLDLEKFAALIERTVFKRSEINELPETIRSHLPQNNETFARRLVTGQAAEEYFRRKHKVLPEFSGLMMKNTTHLGCGFDFCLSSDKVKYGVEVKELRTDTGGIMMTDKEYKVAKIMRGDYFLFVVKNLAQENPSHQLHRDPLSCGLQFSRTERQVVQVSWTVNIGK